MMNLSLTGPGLRLQLSPPGRPSVLLHIDQPRLTLSATGLQGPPGPKGDPLGPSAAPDNTLRVEADGLYAPPPQLSSVQW